MTPLESRLVGSATHDRPPSENEPWLGAFFQASTAGLAILDPELRYIRINETLAAAHGHPVGHHIGRTVGEIIPLLAARLEPVLRNVIATRQPMLDYEICGETAAQPGRIRHWNASYFPLPMFPRDPPGIGVVVVEVTASKEAEEKLRRQQRILDQSERIWRGVFSAVNDAIFVDDADFHVLICNPAAEKLYGYTLIELAAMNQSDLRAMPGFSVAELRRNVAAGHSSWETVHRRKDGSYFEVEVSVHLLALEGDERYIKVVRDITDRRAGERQLRFQASLLDQVSNAVIATDPLGRIMYVNHYAEVLYQWKAAELIGRAWNEVMVPPGQMEAAELIMDQLAKGEPWRGEIDVLCKGGTILPVLIVKTPIYDAARKLIGIVGVAVDITEAKAAEAQLLRSRAQLRALTGRLNLVREEETRRVAREVHDMLGQGVTALKLELQHLEKQLANGGGDVHRQMTRVLHLADRTVDAVQRISLELRLGHLDVVGLPAAISGHLAEFTRRSGIAAHDSLVSEIPDLDRDCATVAFRIFQEALTNVVRHSAATAVDVSLVAEGGSIVLSIQDNGCGITVAQQSHLNSIGLLGMIERAQAIGGSLDISGETGIGTTVTATLPRQRR